MFFFLELLNYINYTKLSVIHSCISETYNLDSVNARPEAVCKNSGFPLKFEIFDKNICIYYYSVIGQFGFKIIKNQKHEIHF